MLSLNDTQSILLKAGLIASKVMGESKNSITRLNCYTEGKEDIWTTKNPIIPIDEYVELIFYNIEIEISTMVISVILYERFLRYTRGNWCETASYHILLTSIIIGIKLNEDSIFDYENFAFLVQVPSSTLFQLESEFLKLINWDIYVDLNSFIEFCSLY